MHLVSSKMHIIWVLGITWIIHISLKNQKNKDTITARSKSCVYLELICLFVCLVYKRRRVKSVVYDWKWMGYYRGQISMRNSKLLNNCQKHEHINTVIPKISKFLWRLIIFYLKLRPTVCTIDTYVLKSFFHRIMTSAS